jgi:CRISPR-associated protein Csb2
MLALRIQFLAGRFHRSAWAEARDDSEIEWPPHPWRVLGVIARAWLGGGQPDREVFANLLNRVSEPPCYLLPRATAGHTRHFTQLGSMKCGKHAGTHTLDSFIALDQGQEPLTAAYVVWPQVELSPGERMLLERSCALLDCLDSTDWACSMRVVDAIPNDEALEVVDIAARSSRQGPTVRRLLVNSSSQSDALLQTLLQTNGKARNTRGVGPAGTAWVEYRLPSDFLMVREQYERPERTQPVFDRMLLRFRLGRGKRSRKPPITDAVVFGELLRAAAIRRLSEREGEPATHRLAGKAPDGSKREGHDHPYFLPFDEQGRGEIDGIDVWFPHGCTHAEYLAVRSVPELREYAINQDTFALTFVGCIQPPRATAWRTATPIILERFPKVRGVNGSRRFVDGPAEQVAEMVRRTIGRDARVEIWPPGRNIECERGGTQRMGLFRRVRLRKPTPPLPAVGATLFFDEPVEGPIVIGRLAHFGLGRFEPDDSRRRADHSGSA